MARFAGPVKSIIRIVFIELFCSNYLIAAALTAFKFNLELMTHETNIGILKINATKKMNSILKNISPNMNNMLDRIWNFG